MIHYAEYDENGRYVARGTILDADDISINEDGGIYIGEVDPLSQYHDIDNDTPTDIPTRPSPNHTFDYVVKGWIDKRSIEQVQDAKWASIKSKRDTAEFSTFTFRGIEYDCDEVSRARIQGAVQLASIALTNEMPYSCDWTAPCFC